MNTHSKIGIFVDYTVCLQGLIKGFGNQRSSACAPAMIGLLMVLLSVQVFAQNTPPTANAGDDLNVFVGEIVQLHGTAIDGNGDAIVSWAWSIDSMPEGGTAFLSDTNAQSPTFTPYLEGGYRISLVVSDGRDKSLPDTVVIEVTASVIPVSITEETEDKPPDSIVR